MQVIAWPFARKGPILTPASATLPHCPQTPGVTAVAATASHRALRDEAVGPGRGAERPCVHRTRVAVPAWPTTCFTDQWLRSASRASGCRRGPAYRIGDSGDGLVEDLQQRRQSRLPEPAAGTSCAPALTLVMLMPWDEPPGESRCGRMECCVGAVGFVSAGRRELGAVRFKADARPAGQQEDGHPLREPGLDAGGADYYTMARGVMPGAGERKAVTAWDQAETGVLLLPSGTASVLLRRTDARKDAAIRTTPIRPVMISLIWCWIVISRIVARAPMA